MKLLLSLMRNKDFFIPFKKRVGYIGWLGRNNLGDEAMFRASKKLFASLNILPFKDTEILSLLKKLKRDYVYDAIFLGGGTLIGKNYLNILKEAKSNSKVKVAFGSGVQNPIFWDKVGINNRLTEWSELLETFNFVGVRGPLSKDILNNYGFRKAEVIGDPALSLSFDRIKRKPRKNLLGINIGVSNGLVWGNEKAILDSIIKLSNVLISKGWELKFLPVWDQDLNYVEEAVKNLRGKAEIFKEWRSINKTLKFLEQCDLFIGEKLHSVILATCAYTPSIMLEYRPKCLDFMMSMDMQDFNIRTDNLSIDLILDLIRRISNDSDQIQNKMFEKVNFFKKIQKNRAESITKLILSKGTK